MTANLKARLGNMGSTIKIPLQSDSEIVGKTVREMEQNSYPFLTQPELTQKYLKIDAYDLSGVVRNIAHYGCVSVEKMRFKRSCIDQLHYARSKTKSQSQRNTLELATDLLASTW